MPHKKKKMSIFDQVEREMTYKAQEEMQDNASVKSIPLVREALDDAYGPGRLKRLKEEQEDRIRRDKAFREYRNAGK